MQERSEALAVSSRLPNRIAAIGAVVHAAVVTTLWWSMIYEDHNLVPVRLWFALSWLWLFWPVAVAVAWARASRLTVVSTLVGAVVISPVVSTIYTATVWLIGGFV